MHIHAYGLAAVIILATTQAAPVQERGLLGSILTSIVSTISSGIQILQLATNACSHGSVWNYHSLTASPGSECKSTRYGHTIKWPKATSWIDWSTYKANGANLGTWLEQEWNLDT
jgi:glucan 1,3-beta-glucosidase